jgi:hypothetical protein
VADLVLAIGGIRAALDTRDSRLPALVRERYAGFITDGPADWRLSASVEPEVAAPGHEVDVRATGSRRFDLARYNFRGALDLAARRGEVRFASADRYALDGFLRVMTSLALGESDGLLIHAASLVRDGRGYLFPGVSGAGKTTLARLSPDATLFSDELSIVTGCGGVPRLHGTPFCGDIARSGENRAAPLGGVYFPRHAAEHRARPLVPRAALRRLLATVMSFPRDAASVADVFGRAAALVAAVPCFELEFRRDPGFWSVIDDA